MAGGHGPYSAVVVDDPAFANDGPLPLGASIPPALGEHHGRARCEVGPGGGPFLVTLRDHRQHRAARADFTFYWLVDTPPIIFATDSLGDGQAGDDLQRPDLRRRGRPALRLRARRGGPPGGLHVRQEHEPGLDPATDVIYNPGAPPTVTPPGALVKIDASVYPLADGPRSRLRRLPPGGAVRGHRALRGHGLALRHPAPQRARSPSTCTCRAAWCRTPSASTPGGRWAIEIAGAPADRARPGLHVGRRVHGDAALRARSRKPRRT